MDLDFEMDLLPTDSNTACFVFNNAGMKDFLATDEQPIIPKLVFDVIVMVTS